MPDARCLMPPEGNRGALPERSMGMDDLATDPFEYCEGRTCAHDLANGVLVSELLTSDGPYRPNHLKDRAPVPAPVPPIHEAA